MSCKSGLYAADLTAQTVAVDGVISFGSIVRRFGCNCGIAGGNVTLTGSGYYNMDADFTFTAGGAGTAVISLYKDGVAIPGATASFTTVANSIYQVSIPAIVRQVCNCETTITAVMTGVAGTINNASIAVEKI